MFTAMISRLHLLVVFLVLALALGVGWAAFEMEPRPVRRQVECARSAGLGAGGRRRPAHGQHARAPAAPDRVASRADRSAEAPGSEPAAQPQQRQPATGTGSGRLTWVAPTSPKLAARDQAPPSKEAATASREPTGVEPPSGRRQTGRSDRSPGEPPSRPAEAGKPSPCPVRSPAGRGWASASRPPRTAPAAPSARRPGTKTQSAPERGAARRPRLARRRGEPPPGQPRGARPCCAESVGQPPERRPAEPEADEPSLWPSRRGSSAGTGSNLTWSLRRAHPATFKQPRCAGGADARPQEQEPEMSPRSAPARAAETIKRALTSLFGGATDARSAPKRAEAEVAAVPVPGRPGRPSAGRRAGRRRRRAPRRASTSCGSSRAVRRSWPGARRPARRSRSGAAIG